MRTREFSCESRSRLAVLLLFAQSRSDVFPSEILGPWGNSAAGTGAGLAWSRVRR
jgi:hypothetical protein